MEKKNLMSLLSDLIFADVPLVPGIVFGSITGTQILNE